MSRRSKPAKSRSAARQPFYAGKPQNTQPGQEPISPENDTIAFKADAPRECTLFEQARLQWRLGDWESLAELAAVPLESHPERDKLALLAAVGQLQKNDAAAARQFVRLAQEWGCVKQLIGQVLLVGLYTSLGRAAAAAGEDTRAFKHFSAASTIVGQCFSDLAPRSPGSSSQAPFEAGRVAYHDLGDAWASNTVNTVIFRHHGILTRGKFQFTAFYADENTLRVVRRDLSQDTLDMFDLPGEYRLRDAHNSISLGCDREDYIHISYDHHSTRLRYRRSAKPLDIQAWTDECGMTGVHEDKVTYPSFILPAGQQPLLLLYRDGVWNKGTARLKVYNEASRQWSDRPTPILSGAEQRPWTCNAYWNHPVTGSDGSLHLSFVWRADSLGEEQRINNISVCYARSEDRGLTWQTSRGHGYKLPITPVNAEVVYPVSPGSNLINQTSMALDSRNHPHIVFYSDDPNGIPQYQHLWLDGKTWRHQYISQRETAFDLTGGGTLQIPISRPEIVVDCWNNAYVIYRGDFTGGKMTILRLAAPDYRYDPAQALAVWDEELGYAEPIIDRVRWQQSNILTLLLQHNQQPDGDTAHELLSMPVTLLDLQLC